MTTASRFVGCLALSALGCVDLRYAGEDAALDAADTPVTVDATDASDTRDTVDAPDGTDARDAMNAPDAADVVEAFDASDARDVMTAPDAADVTDVTDATDAMDVADARDAADAMDVADVADVRDVVDATVAVDGVMRVDALPARDAADVATAWGPIRLTSPTATFSQAGGYGVSRAINGQLTEGQGWGIAPVPPTGVMSQTAAFEFETTTPVSATGTRVVVTLINYSLGYRLVYFRLTLTNASRDTFADGRETLGDPTGTATWITPTIVSVEATNGVSIFATGPTIQADESVARSTYTITLDVAASQLTGIRLEALRNAALTYGGPGTDDSINSRGNFSLTEIQVSAGPRS